MNESKDGPPDDSALAPGIPAEIPAVIPVTDDVPLVQRVEPALAVPPRPWPGWWAACLLTLGYWLVMLVVMVGVVAVPLVMHLAGGQPGGEDVPAMGGVAMPEALHFAVTISMLLAYAGGLLYSIVILRYSLGRGWTRTIGLRRLPLPFLFMALVALPGFMLGSDFVATGVAWLLDELGRALGLGKLPTIEVKLDEQFGPYHWTLAVLIIGVAPGLAEEFWCRGFLGRGLVGRYGPVAGILLASGLFGLLHLWPPVYVVTTALMGMALHFTYLMSRSLWVPIVIHLVNNSFAGLTELKVVNAEPLKAVLESQPLPLALLSFGLLVFAGLAMWSARGRIVTREGEPAHAADPGIMVPDRQSQLRIAHSAMNPFAATVAVALCAAIFYLTLAR